MGNKIHRISTVSNLKHFFDSMFLIMDCLQSGDDDFPAPPPASDMLNMEFAPERSHTEVPIAPSTFQPMHIAVSITIRHKRFTRNLQLHA